MSAPAPEAAPEHAGLPVGFEARLRRDLLRADDGRVLVGGSPMRALRLSERARALLGGGGVVVTDATSAALARRLLDGNLADPVVPEAVGPPADLTVVVPVRGRAAQLDRCLAALAPLPVVVVDDASPDPGPVARVAERHGAVLVRLPENLGPAGARNAGLARVATPLVGFVDSDVVVAAGTLRALARHLTDARVALVGPRVVGRPRSGRLRWFERYDAAASSLDLGRVGGQVRPGAHVGWLPSACLVGRTAALEGGFDASLRVGEDVDLVWRLVEGGAVVRYAPDLVAHHDVRGTVRGWLGRKFVYGTGGAGLGRRHGAKVAPAALSWTAGTAAAALLVRRRWSLPVATAAGAITVRSLVRRLPATDRSRSLAVRLTVRGTGWAVRQEAALLLRHWWPATALAACLSRDVRRAVVSALVVDLVVFRHERPGVDPLTALVARRLDDAAYGAGLWWGALRSRDLRCLVPRRPRG